MLELAGLFAEDDEGRPVIEAVNLKVHAGEIVGIAGVSGNGQSRAGRGAGRPARADRRRASSSTASRSSRSASDFDRFKVFGLPEEPLKNATVPRMSVAENIAFRTFDKPPIASLGWWLSPGPMRAQGART